MLEERMANLDKIKTIVVVMMENRSFDHMLGYLSLPPFNRTDVNGQSTGPAWLAQFTNNDQGQPIQPFLNNNPYTLPPGFDPPHGRGDVEKHLGTLQGGAYPMNGFVRAIPDTVSTDPNVRRLVMGYFGASEAPINDFFATNFTICDRWFCSLPAGTQANRLIAMSGFSMIDNNTVPLPPQDLVYDWLNARGVSWRVYHQGVPFFTLMFKWVDNILFDDHFRPFKDFQRDMANTPPGQRPQVIFIEPTYGDCPHLGRWTDDHAPSGISDGQEFLMQVYTAMVASPSFWQSSVLIVSYDEHGGFFDHVSPPLIPTDPPQGATYPRFESLGVRTPAYVISPFVKPGTTAKNLFDHTSVLRFLGEKFGVNGSYSPVVDARPVESVSAVFDFNNPILAPPLAPATHEYLNRRPPEPIGATVPVPDTELKEAFRQATEEMKRKGAGPTHPKFGTLLQQIPDRP